jgi:hypothetical protein
MFIREGLARNTRRWSIDDSLPTVSDVAGNRDRTRREYPVVIYDFCNDSDTTCMRSRLEENN